MCSLVAMGDRDILWLIIMCVGVCVTSCVCVCVYLVEVCLQFGGPFYWSLAI